MPDTITTWIHGQVIEETPLSLRELCRICGIAETEIVAWVEEGVLEAQGQSPDNWQFSGMALRRARSARRLRELDLNAAGIALALDLLEEIHALRILLRRSSTIG